jgi:hypothetical protein
MRVSLAELMDLVKNVLANNDNQQLTVSGQYLLDCAKFVRTNVLAFMDAGTEQCPNWLFALVVTISFSEIQQCQPIRFPFKTKSREHKVRMSL